MNILIFVMSMLMIFVLMTYSRLDTYRTSTAVEGEFTRYMEQIERTYINMSADRLYEKVAFPKKTTETASAEESATQKDEDAPKKGKSTGRLSIAPLLNKKDGDEGEKEVAETSILLKRLILALYGDQKQFQEAIKKRPTLIEELLERIKKAAKALPDDKKIKSAPELSNLELGDGLDEAFYMMLKGCPAVITPAQIDDPAGKSEDQADDSDEAEEFTSDKSYDSLLNFIDTHPSLKINIYIASTPLLTAIYGDPAIVASILSTRYQLYKAVDQKDMTSDEASDRLKAEFQQWSNDILLDYKVTKSDPRRYN